MSEIIKRRNSQIIGMTLSELENLSEESNLPRFRGRQLFNSVYKQQIDSFNDIKTLPIIFRDILLDKYILHPLSLIKKTGSDTELTQKYLFKLSTGEKIESVLNNMRLSTGELWPIPIVLDIVGPAYGPARRKLTKALNVWDTDSSFVRCYIQ